MKEFFKYMKGAAPKEVPFLVKSGVTAFHEGWGVDKVMGCLQRYSDDLSKFISTHGALGGDVMALQNYVRGEIVDLRETIYSRVLQELPIQIYTNVSFACPPFPD